MYKRRHQSVVLWVEFNRCHCKSEQHERFSAWQRICNAIIFYVDIAVQWIIVWLIPILNTHILITIDLPNKTATAAGNDDESDKILDLTFIEIYIKFHHKHTSERTNVQQSYENAFRSNIVIKIKVSHYLESIFHLKPVCSQDYRTKYQIHFIVLQFTD